MSTTVLATKLFAPSRRERLVARPRLFEELDGSLSDNHRLTLVSAPAGFGKSTLVSDWVDSLRQRQQSSGAARASTTTDTAWLSLDAGDNDLARLLPHLVAALQRCGLDIDLPGLGAPGAAPDVTAILTTLVNDIVAAGEQAPARQWVVVLDDYHLIETPGVHEAFDFLLDNLPRQLHLVVVTRSDPPLRVARLRSRGQLVELRAVDLRFTATEAQEFLEHVMGLQLTVDDVEALEERTEGWIAGLQLAALSLRSSKTRDETAEFIADFTGSNRFVIDYLLDEVLARLPAATLDFLLRTSILDRLTGTLCDQVTHGSDSVTLLERLERDNLFVVGLDAERSWFRYHHLFADVLKARLLASDPSSLPVLHRRASDWYADQGLVVDAVQHALAGGDHARAALLIEEAIPATRRARQDATLLTWMGALPDEVVRNSPVLSIVTAWSMMVAGDLTAMEARLDDAEAALAAGADNPGVAGTWADTEDLRTAPATVHLYRAALAQARGDVDATKACARRALGIAGPDDHFVRGAAGGLLGLATWAAGDVNDAIVTFTDAVRSLHEAGNLVDELDSAVVLGEMWMTAGRPGQARATYDQALVAADELGEPHPRAAADLHVGLAELAVELNDVTSARKHLEIAKTLSDRGSITEHQHGWYVVAARVHAATGDHAMAVQLLDHAQSLYRPGFYPDIRPISAQRARVHIVDGDLGRAHHWAREQELSLSDDVTFLREYEHLTLIRLVLAVHRTAHQTCEARAPAEEWAEGWASSFDEVLDALDRLADSATNHRRDETLLEIGLLRAITLDAVGERDAALAELDRTLLRAPEPGNYVRLFLDEGAPLRSLLEDAAARPTSAQSAKGTAGATVGVAVKRHARRVLAAANLNAEPSKREPEEPAQDETELTRSEPQRLDAGAGATTASDAGLFVGALSERELEVLRLLESDLTGPEIARHMYVTVNTLRTHTKRIFTKLHVRSRSAAVRRARELGLL